MRHPDDPGALDMRDGGHLDEGTIHAWLDGALDQREAAPVERHAAECAACAAVVAEARGLIAGASRIIGDLDAPGIVLPASADRAPAVRAPRDSDAVVPLASRRFPRFRRAERGLAVLAAAAVVAAVGLTVARQDKGAPFAGSEMERIAAMAPPSDTGIRAASSASTSGEAGATGPASAGPESQRQSATDGGAGADASRLSAPPPALPRTADPSLSGMVESTRREVAATTRAAAVPPDSTARARLDAVVPATASAPAVADASRTGASPQAGVAAADAAPQRKVAEVRAAEEPRATIALRRGAAMSAPTSAAAPAAASRSDAEAAEERMLTFSVGGVQVPGCLRVELRGGTSYTVRLEPPAEGARTGAATVSGQAGAATAITWRGRWSATPDTATLVEWTEGAEGDGARRLLIDHRTGQAQLLGGTPAAGVARPRGC